MNNYVVMHIHSMLSNGTTNIDSITNFRAYVKKAKEYAMRAICFTEHGNIFEHIHKKEEIEKAGMLYIHGVEAYVTESLDAKVRDNYHCILAAKNYKGFLELNAMLSHEKAYNRNDGHFYYMPRITFDELINTSDNIIISTACLGGILNNGNDGIREKFIAFLKDNKHRCFLEIQHHNATEQIAYNQYLYELSKTIDVPLIAGTDTHALNEAHLRGRAKLQKAKGVHFDNEDNWDLTFKTYDELVQAYKKQNSLPMEVVLQAIENTNKFADMVETYDIDRSYKYPHLWEKPMETFRAKIQQGITARGVNKYPNYQQYLDRIEYEIQAYEHNQAIDFMLLMEDIIAWCRTQGIQVGYGRGSVNGSVIAWLLGITEMDSIKHNLNFERFMNIERVSLSDIDTDFPPSRIKEVKDYIFSKHGLYCCDIITFNTISDKGAIKDIGRAFEMPLDEVSKISESVDDPEEYEKMRKSYPGLFEYVDLVKDTIVSVGSHPCGTVVAPCPVIDKFSTFTTSTSDYPISQINMKEIDSLNYVKLDLLKLDTIEIISETCKLAGISMLTPDNMDITDVKVWNEIRDDTTQIFQWEGDMGNQYIKRLLSDVNIKKFQKVNSHVDRMTLFSIGNSAIRPAGASYRDDLANGIVRTTGAKPIDDFLSNTFGYLVFQCQIIEFLHSYCGFTMGEADIVRRGFAKKSGTEQYIPIIKNGGKLNNHEIKGYLQTMREKYGIFEVKSEKDIAAFIKVIEDASNYLFSLNHSQPYSYMGYAEGWLRTYYLLEFATAALNVNSGKEQKTLALTLFAKKKGVKFLSPKFGHSKGDYFFDKKNNAIYKGIGSIKYMNTELGNSLYQFGNDTKCKTFIDLLYLLKIRDISINSRQIDILIKIDYFEGFGEINALLRQKELFDKFYGKKNIKKDVLTELNIPHEITAECAVKESTTQFSTADTYTFLQKLSVYEKIAPCTLSQRINYQWEHLGYIDYVNPELSTRYVCVTELSTQNSPKFTAYCLAKGSTAEFKIYKAPHKRDYTVKTTFADLPIKNGDVIYIKQFKKQPKFKLINDKWSIVPNEFEWWITDYKIVENIESETNGGTK